MKKQKRAHEKSRECAKKQQDIRRAAWRNRVELSVVPVIIKKKKTKRHYTTNHKHQNKTYKNTHKS